MPAADGNTALVVLVPEAEPAVAALRAAHDSSAALGVAAHVTLLFPFVPLARWHAGLDAQLAALFSRFVAFDARFRDTARFGDAVLYLAPEPAEPFSALTEAIAAAFPEHPPYEGVHPAVIPHLTVAD